MVWVLVAVLISLGLTPLGPAGAATNPYVVAVGDIACAPGSTRTSITCHEDGVAALFATGGALAGSKLKAILVLGDAQYQKGKYTEFTYSDSGCSVIPIGTDPCSFDDSFGYAKATGSAQWRPTVGNHEYQDTTTPFPGCRLVGVTASGASQKACGYEKYFGSGVVAPTARGDGKGNYSFTYDSGAAHPILFISLNTGQCQKNSSYCSSSGPVVSFLKSTLASSTLNPGAACVVVYSHHPAFSYYGHPNISYAKPVWQALFSQTGAKLPDLVLNGHSHNYQRFDPLNIDGRKGTGSPSIPEIIVGNGGKDLVAAPSNNPDPNIPAAPAYSSTNKFGALKLSWSASSGSLTVGFYREGTTSAVDSATYTCR